MSAALRLPEPIIRNSKGEQITLNAHERYRAERLQLKLVEDFKETLPSLMNSLGYEIQITTLTTIIKKITGQKFFEIAPSDYLPVRVGEGAWSDFLTTYRSFDAADAFETGLINQGNDNARVASVGAAVDSVSRAVLNWAKSNEWTIFAMEQAARAGNWDYVTAKEKARKRNWDLGIQRVAFLGANGQNGANGNCLGLLNQSGITNNTTVITKPISTMTPTELQTLTASLVNAYRSNCQRSAWPTHFEIPESDWLGMAATVSPDFPIKTMLELLEDMFKANVPNGKFKGILPVSYADAAYHVGVAGIDGRQVYTLLNYDEESLVMDIPVDYTPTLANSINGFQFQNVAYGQFTGVQALRPLEMLYFSFAAS